MRPLKDVFKSVSCPDLLVGIDTADDAAVYRFSPDRAVVFTTDFFTPVVDDPYSFGSIAAANSMSDVFAMGGTVLLALNIAGFPEDLPEAVMSEILRGGAEKVRSAGGVIAGGHTISSKEPFYGLAVCGLVHPEKLLEKAGARPGDLLILTKPLGTGLVTTAFKGGVCRLEYLEEAIRVMKILNLNASLAAGVTPCRTATDVTGFSLIGHAMEIASSSRVSLELKYSDIPFLPGVDEYADQWLFPAGSTRNEKAYGCYTVFDSDISREKQMVLFTPETSGGLLIALSADCLSMFEKECSRYNQMFSVIGRVIQGKPGITVRY